jgi:hypothetical protein
MERVMGIDHFVGNEMGRCDSNALGRATGMWRVNEMGRTLVRPQGARHGRRASTHVADCLKPRK